MFVGKERLEIGLCILQVTLGSRVVPLLTVGSELGDGDCCQDTDNRNNDQQFDEGEAFSVSDSVKHDGFSFRLMCAHKSGLSSEAKCIDSLYSTLCAKDNKMY